MNHARPSLPLTAAALAAVAGFSAFAAASLLAPAAASAAEHRLGLGFHYWRTIDEIEEDDFDIDDDGLALIASYQYVPSILRFELDVEYFDEGFGGATEEAFSPQALILLGKGIYGGLGVGVTYSKGLEDGDVSDPFYLARGGFDWAVLPGVHLDFHANYYFDAFKELEDIDTEVLTLGVIGRVAF